MEIVFGKNKRCIPAIVLEGLHFDVLLGMSWIKETNTMVKATEGLVSIDGEVIKYKPYPEPALFIVEEGVRVYSCELMVLSPGKNVGVPVRHNVVTGNEVYFVKYKEDLNLEGEILKLASDDGQIHRCELIGKGKTDRVIQKGQCLGSIYPLLDASNSFINKNNSNSYFVIRTFDLEIPLKHLAGPMFKEFFKLFSCWLNVFSRNKYDVGLTTEEYYIRLADGTPVKSYVPRRSPAVVKAIESELEKLERAEFIEPSISPYSAPTVCVKKLDGTLRVTIDFRMVNKKVINDAYPMH